MKPWSRSRLISLVKLGIERKSFFLSNPVKSSYRGLRMPFNLFPDIPKTIQFRQVSCIVGFNSLGQSCVSQTIRIIWQTTTVRVISSMVFGWKNKISSRSTWPSSGLLSSNRCYATDTFLPNDSRTCTLWFWSPQWNPNWITASIHICPNRLHTFLTLKRQISIFS